MGRRADLLYVVASHATAASNRFCCSEPRCRQVDGLEAEHYFRAKGSMIAAAAQPKMKRGAMLRIHQELSSISTNLPLSVASSIFVVVDETRSDMLRALITGPKSTPYAQG